MKLTEQRRLYNAHAALMNFSGFATPERNVILKVNDVDETLPAPFLASGCGRAGVAY